MRETGARRRRGFRRVRVGRRGAPFIAAPPIDQLPNVACRLLLLIPLAGARPTSRILHEA